MKNLYIRKINEKNAEQVIEDVGFDRAYIHKAVNKYNFLLLKIHNLSCPQASILKQLALSLGADAAVHREVITCGVDTTDILLGCTKAQLCILCEKLKFQPFKLKEVADSLLNQININPKPIKIRDQVFNWGSKTYLMGILNVTPDSFSDGGNYLKLSDAIKHTQKIILDGADIIDIGGESTRPFSKEIPPDEELNRVIPIIKEIRKFNTTIPISIDTRHSIVARQAIENGADIINDVSGLKWDSQMVTTAAELNVPVIAMHSPQSPESMQVNPEYSENVVDAIAKDIYDNCKRLIESGISEDNIIIDPGIGFGKTMNHNLEIIQRVSEFKSLGSPLLMGISRKSFIKNILDNTVDNIEDANLSLASYMAINGVDIIRVHDVKRHFNALTALYEIIKNC
jgi:dihydropteroate synthase